MENMNESRRKIHHSRSEQNWQAACPSSLEEIGPNLGGGPIVLHRDFSKSAPGRSPPLTTSNPSLEKTSFAIRPKNTCLTKRRNMAICVRSVENL
jgi:hypothetical protein